MTPAQKRAKAKEIQMRKREAAKKKAEKQRAAKAKAAKKKRIKEGKPLLYIYSYNLQTGEPLPATFITAQDVNAKPMFLLMFMQQTNPEIRWKMQEIA